MNDHHLIAPLVVALLLMLVPVQAGEPPPPVDPVHAQLRALFAAQPVGKHHPKDTIGDPPARETWPGAAASHYEVPYLGPGRDRLFRIGLDGRDRRAQAGHPYALEWRARCDIHVPPGNGPFPCLIMVHGGSYTGGSKEGPGWMSQRDRDLRNAGMEKGWVVVSINYLLGDGIHPQVQRDTREAVRFLRANAAIYRINPHRIGLVGSSAGGWLVGSSSLTTMDDGWVARDDWRYRTAALDSSGHRNNALLLPGDAVNTAHAEHSARVSVAIVDFIDGTESASPDDPHVLTVTGGTSRKEFPGLGALTVVNLPKHKNSTDVHLPDTSQPVTSADGSGEVNLFQRCLQFIEEHLAGPAARSPAPEARPQQRWFTETTEVELVGSGPGVTIHYTTDGSEPSAASPRYEQPIRISANTEIKAIAIAPGMQPSGAMTARYFRGPLPPEISGPESLILPPATVGEPYEVTFTAPGAGRWLVLMQTAAVTAPGLPEGRTERPAHLMRHGHGALNGLPAFPEGETCTIRGTPLRPGWTTVLVAASHPAGQGNPVAGDRLYLLRIDP